MITAAHHQRPFRAEQTGFFFVLCSCEVAGLRSLPAVAGRGISLRSVRPGTASRLLRSYCLRATDAAACFATSSDNQNFQPSTLQVQPFQKLPNSLPLFGDAALCFQYFPNSFSQKHPGWGIPPQILRFQSKDKK
jgi:hypothetical protein